MSSKESNQSLVSIPIPVGKRDRERAKKNLTEKEELARYFGSNGEGVSKVDEREFIYDSESGTWS
jgi:hypothetical protein